MGRNDFDVRLVNIDDIDILVKARVKQEADLGNSLSSGYTEIYKNILLKLMDENKVIGAGVFYNGELISVAYLNLLNYGHEKLVPYYCAAWTKKEYRGRGLIALVNEKLDEAISKRANEMESFMFTTVDGGEPASRAFSKGGYYFIDGEMSFLGDVAKEADGISETICSIDGSNKEMCYAKDGREVLRVLYTEEQLFAHPANESGKLSRIVGFKILEPIDKDTFIQIIKHFLSTYRFCKLNINEVVSNSLTFVTSLGFDVEKVADFALLLNNIGFKMCNNIMVRSIEELLKSNSCKLK